MTSPACLGHDPELWFSPDPDEQQRAKGICAGCPLRAACLDGARARREPWGVWGGEVFDLLPDDVMVVAEARIRVAIASRHGSRGRYSAGCRCPECTEANTSWMRGYRDHGPVTARETIEQQFEQMTIGA